MAVPFAFWKLLATPLPPTPSVDFLVFDILLDTPDYATDTVDTLGYISSAGLVESNAQVDRVQLKQLIGTSDNDASYMATERLQQDAFSNTLYRYIVDFARIQVVNPSITQVKFKIHIKQTSGDGSAGANRVFFTRQAGGVKQTVITGTGAIGCTTVGATTLDSTIIQPPFATGSAGALNPVAVPAFIEITYNYTTFAMSYVLL